MDLSRRQMLIKLSHRDAPIFMFLKVLFIRERELKSLPSSLQAYCLCLLGERLLSPWDHRSCLLTLLTASSFSSLQSSAHVACWVNLLNVQCQDSAAPLKTSADPGVKL